MVYNVHDFGAVGDGIHNDTSAIQAAIDACTKNGGGQVILNGGHTYRTGTLILKSYVDLHLETGAILKGSDHLEDYNVLGLCTHMPAQKHLDVPTYENCDYNGAPTLYFLYAKDSEYVSISGQGKIDGNESIFHGDDSGYHIDGYFYPRIPMLFLEHIEHLSIQDVTLTSSAFWTVHLVGCEDVLIDGIRILNSMRMANCDGIDPDHCKNVRIANCHIECADDCIVFKNTSHANKYGACENICVTNCTMSSTSAAIKFGSESDALFRNITITNCNIHHTNRAISFMLRDSGSIENVVFSNINIDTRRFSPAEWWGAAEPISITAVRRMEDTKIGHIKNVTFENITCDCENGIFIHGEETRNIENLYFCNVTLAVNNKSKWPKKGHDLRPCIGNGMLQSPLSVVYARNAADVTFERFRYLISEEMKAYAGQDFDVENCTEFHH